MPRVVVFALVFLLLAPVINFHEANATSVKDFQAYQITINGALSNVFLLTVKPYWRVKGSSPGEYRLLYTAYPSYRNITNWTFEYVNLTDFPGVTHKLGNVTLPWPTNNFTIQPYDGVPIIHWQAGNGTVYNYLWTRNYFWICNNTVPVVIPHNITNTTNSQLIGSLEGNYVVFNGPNTTLRIPVKELLKYYPKQFLNDLGGMTYSNISLFIYPLHLSYWKIDGKVYVGVDFSKGVELKANQSLPILLYSKGTLKPLVDVLRLITPKGDPIRNLKNPATLVNVTPTSPYDALFYYPFSQFYELHYSLASNGTSAILTVTRGDTFVPRDVEPPSVIPSYYPYLVVNGVPRFFNLSSTWGNAKEPWWLYEFKFSVWNGQYELLWKSSPPTINTSSVYHLEGTCWRRAVGFHYSNGSVARGVIDGNYMVFRFNRTTLRIPLNELAEYYPPKVWEWQLAAAKDGENYLIIPTAGFDYTSGGIILSWGDYVLLVDNSSGVYALYYVNGTLKPAFDLLRLMSPQGDLVRGLSNPYFNSSITFKLCNATTQTQVKHANTSTVRITETTKPKTTKEKSICGPGFIVVLSVFALFIKKRRG